MLRIPSGVAKRHPPCLKQTLISLGHLETNQIASWHFPFVGFSTIVLIFSVIFLQCSGSSYISVYCFTFLPNISMRFYVITCHLDLNTSQSVISVLIIYPHTLVMKLRLWIVTSRLVRDTCMIPYGGLDKLYKIWMCTLINST